MEPRSQALYFELLSDFRSLAVPKKTTEPLSCFMLHYLRFPMGSLHTSNTEECWRLIRVGDSPLGFGEWVIIKIVSLERCEVTAEWIVDKVSEEW